MVSDWCRNINYNVHTGKLSMRNEPGKLEAGNPILLEILINLVTTDDGVYKLVFYLSYHLFCKNLFL